MSNDKNSKTTDQGSELAAEQVLDGIPRERIVFSAGFCLGLSTTSRYNFKDNERKLLRIAGNALMQVGTELYDS